MQIRIETDRVLIIRRRHTMRSWCQECGREVDMLRAEEAAALSAQQSIRDCSAHDEWHVSHLPGGPSLICLDSVVKSL